MSGSGGKSPQRAPAEFSGEIAAFYDARPLLDLELPPFFRKCVDFQVRPELKGRALRVLDLGCGSGRVSAFLARHYGFAVTGVDVSATAIRTAQEHAERSGLTIRFVEGDILSKSTGLGAFDIVFGHFILHEFIGRDFERLAEVLSEHVAPGGYGTFLENSYFNPMFRWIREALPSRWRVSHAREYPFDRERYEVLGKYFRSVRRDCPAVNLAERFYRQLWPARLRAEPLYAAAAAFDHGLTLGLPAAMRRWVSYFQVVSFSQGPVEPRLNGAVVRRFWYPFFSLT